MKSSRRNLMASEKYKFTLLNKCVVCCTTICLLLSYYGIIKGSIVQMIAGLAVVVGISFLKNGLKTDQIDKLN